MPTKGVIWMDASLSMYYSPSKSHTRAYLHGCSEPQILFIQQQLRAFSSIASHPLLLPVILVAMKQHLIGEQESRLWTSLVDVETRSGLTGAPRMDTHPRPGNQLTEYNIEIVTMRALGVVQIATYAETHAKALLVMIEAIMESIKSVTEVTPHPNKTNVEKAGSLLSEQLVFLAHKTRVLLGDIQFVEKRAQVQITAVRQPVFLFKALLLTRPPPLLQVYNFLAQKDARIGQKLATDSSQIARASKRDSSAMRGLAVLTMVFLPGTFISVAYSLLLPSYTSTRHARG
jgi:hypothetical protein